MSYQIPPHCSKRPVSISNNHPRAHNLDIRSYTFEELLNIFNLPSRPNEEDMKQAKKKMLMVHPDKSNLPPDYFLFYQKAYQTIVNNLEANKTLIRNQYEPTTTAPVYRPMQHTDEHTASHISAHVNKMNKNQFQSKFNQMFDENVGFKPDESKNAWFKSENTDLQYQGKVSVGNMGTAFQTLKSVQKQNAMVQYTGEVRELRSGGGNAVNYYASNPYEDEDDDKEYKSSDPFSKLRFEDLRKVHKDQTIFHVSEADYGNVRTFQNADQYARERVDVAPMEKQEAERILQHRQNEYLERMSRKKHAAEMEALKFEEINRKVHSQFLQLENGQYVLKK